MRTRDVDDMSSLERRACWQTGRILSPEPRPKAFARTHLLNTGNACLHFEEGLGEALQRSVMSLTSAHARSCESVRVLRVLRLLPIFGRGERWSLAELVATCS